MVKKQATNIFGGMQADNASLTRASTSPGKCKVGATARSMPHVVAMTKAAGMLLPMVSPTTNPRRSHKDGCLNVFSEAL
jgi:hypothetical protein